jgi:hypothetical protein
MPLRVKALTILDDTLQTAVNRLNAVVGMNVDKLNVRVELDTAAARADEMPDEIPIEVQAVEPILHRDPMSSMTGPLHTIAKANGKPGTYLVRVDPAELRPLLKAGDALPKVATVVRDGGTSAKKFRSRLAEKVWAMRGHAMQPKEDQTVDTVTGEISDDRPDAKTLFKAGGVELLQASVSASADLQLNPLASSWAFVRSPADVFFYSGHGAFWNGSLLLDTTSGYKPWLTPKQILEAWKVPIDVLIINGCSAIGYWGPATDPDTQRAVEVNSLWQKLLKSEGGPLTAILGYRGTAPMDQMDGDRAGGDKIAEEMAQAMLDVLKRDWGSYARKWVEINARHPLTRTAAAMDEKGYYYINLEYEPASHTHGEEKLPGFDKNLDEGTLMLPS